MKYRKEIDGLRAVAVIPVILFHMGYSIFNGGFLGVDVFFVISGFLITTILMEETQKNRFSIFNFYDRRARRILPALFFIIFASIILSWLVMLPSQIKDFGQSVLAAIGFSSNIYFWLKLDYWGQSAEFVPLLHIWSLAVEEQFYFIFPFIVILAKKKSSLKGLTLIIILTSFISMVAMQLMGNTSEAFYLPVFRAWELAAGSLAATLRTNNIQPRFASVFSILGGILLLVSLCFFNKYTPYAILHALPVLGTFLIILYTYPRSLVAQILSTPALVSIGLISYSLYLTHQPVLAFMRIYIAHPLDVTNKILCLVIIILVSFFSYQFIEKPFRHKEMTSNSRYYLGLFGITLAFSIYAFAAHRSEGFKTYKLAQMPQEQARLVDLLTQQKEDRAILWSSHLGNAKKAYINDDRKRLLIVGDSISEDLYVAGVLSPSMSKLVEIRRLPLDESCIASKGKFGSAKEYATCQQELNAFLASDLLSQADVIVLAASWLPDNAKSLGNFLEFGGIRDKKVVVFLQHQFMDMNSVIMGGDKFNYDFSGRQLATFIYSNRHGRTLMSNKILKRISEKNNMSSIDGFTFFCNGNSKQCNIFDGQNRPLLIDIVHMSTTGVHEFSPWLTSKLIPLL
jgi:peptidoglycan/LPS O-acetylase OafA/YrhL